MTFHSFHSLSDSLYADSWWSPSIFGDTRSHNVETRDVKYRFFDHFHPFVGDVFKGEGQNQQLIEGLASRLVKAGVDGLLEADTARADGSGDVLSAPEDAALFDDGFFDLYQPNHVVFADDDEATPELEGRPIKVLDFSPRGAYSVYNWEVFYHVPMAIAVHLSRNQRFADAQRWLHLIFDPTDDTHDAALGPASPQLGPERRFWKVQPFQLMQLRRIEHVLVNLAERTDQKLLADTLAAIEELWDKPFRPFVVARHHQWSFMYRALYAYLDNLIAWGDHLFRQDTRESINEAAQLYVMAANLLGSPPQEVPRAGRVKPRSYADIRPDLHELGSILVDVETALHFDAYPLPPQAPADDGSAAAQQIGTALYFCVPRNQKLLDYWDTVADRLFKIRNSLNIHGVFRQLPLFALPIDPALLARGAAAGLDVSAVIAGLNQPLPLVRFQYLIRKAQELAAEVRNLGDSLLSAMREEDNERLTLLQTSHQRAILDITEAIRYGQWQEALKTRDGIERTLNLAVGRYLYFERLLGMDPNEIELPEMDDLDAGQLVNGRLRSTEPEVSPREIPVDISAGPLSDVSDLFSLVGELHLNPGEAWALRTRALAELPLLAAQGQLIVAALMHLIPDFIIAAHPMGAGADTKPPTGEKVANSMENGAQGYVAIGEALNRWAGRSETAGGYARREQEWAFQSTQAAGDIGQIHKQLRAAQIREFVAKREYESHKLQIKQAEEIEDFLTNERSGKTTGRSFYAWLRRELQALHSQSYQLAFDVAKKAERALQHELGDESLVYLRYNYAAGKEGLLSGQRLQLALQQMEIDYHDRNRREYELTKTASLQQVNPLAVLQLRETGKCTFVLPEQLFDLDGPHYFRRIQTIAVTIPAVVGQFTSINCTLRLIGSSIRTTPSLLNGLHAREGSEDPRFSDHYGMVESIVTSAGQNDPGVLPAAADDVRNPPFRGSGVISEWQLELPANPADGDPAQFDYRTITDVFLHISYTAREGGATFKRAAMAGLKEAIARAEAAGSTRMFSVRHEFPAEWAQFKSRNIDASNPTAVLSLSLRPEHYPFWSQGRLGQMTQLELIARTSLNSVNAGFSSNLDISLTGREDLGGLISGLATAPPPATGPLEFHFDTTNVHDLWLLATTRP